MMLKQSLSSERPNVKKRRLSKIMKLRFVQYAAVLGLALSAFPLLIHLHAQQPAKVEEDIGEPIKVDVDVMNLYCAVRNKQNGLIGNLNKSDFDLAEDGKAQTIKYFSRETNIPLTIGLLVDVSMSQQNLLETERRAAAAFFTSVLKEKDVAFLIS